MMKINSKEIIITLLLLPFWGAVGLAQELGNYLQIAAENNPEVKAAFAQYEAALQETPQVSSLPDPTLSGSAFGIQMMETPLGSQMARFQLMQMFPWFGTLGAKKDAANLKAEAKFQEYLDVRSQLFYEVKSAYAELFEIRKTIELQEENLDILDSYRELALSKFRSGSSKMVNVVRIDIEREAANTEIEVLKHHYKRLTKIFNLILNREASAKVEILDSLSFTEEEKMGQDMHFENHPGILQYEKLVQSYEKEEEVAEKEGLPMLGFGLDYRVISPRTDANPPGNGKDAIMPMFSVSLPIFRKKYKAARKEAEFMAESMEAEQQAKENQLRTTFQMTQHKVMESRKLIDLYDRQIKSAQQARKLLISGFGNATEDFEEVLRINQDILMFRIEQITALKEGFTAQARMEYLSFKTANYDENRP